MTTAWRKTKDHRIKKRGEVYWARFMKRGQHVQESLETRSFEVAKRLVENIEKDILLGVNWKKERELFETAWVDFLIDKVNGVKTKKARRKTISEYTQFGDRFYLPKFKDWQLSEINEDGWKELVEDIKKEKPGIQFDNIRKYLMGFLSWAYRKGKIRVKPELFDPDIERKENLEEPGPGKAYTLRELEVMRTIAGEMGSEKFYLFILMAQYMGMRPGEITQLKKDRIDLDKSTIRLRRADTKTKHHREIPIHAVVKPLLEKQYWATKSGCLFPNQRDETRPMDPTGFKGFWEIVMVHPDLVGRVYDFRHTWITNAALAGMNPVVIAKITGTSLEMILERYFHVNKDELSKAMEAVKL